MLLQLSPCLLLNSREKFRQAPPDLPQIKPGDIEGFFGALLTLYHIRKLISSHGIRPAYEMLEEKLKQGYGFSILSVSSLSLLAHTQILITISYYMWNHHAFYCLLFSS